MKGGNSMLAKDDKEGKKKEGKQTSKENVSFGGIGVSSSAASSSQSQQQSTAPPATTSPQQTFSSSSSSSSSSKKKASNSLRKKMRERKTVNNPITFASPSSSTSTSTSAMLSASHPAIPTHLSSSPISVSASTGGAATVGGSSPVLSFASSPPALSPSSSSPSFSSSSSASFSSFTTSSSVSTVTRAASASSFISSSSSSAPSSAGSASSASSSERGGGGEPRIRRERSYSSMPGLISKCLVVEVNERNEALTSALVAFLDAFLAPDKTQVHRQAAQWYYGDCRVVRHGEGTFHRKDGQVLRGAWEHNVFKGPITASSAHMKGHARLGSGVSLSPRDIPADSEGDSDEEEEEAASSPPLSPPDSSALGENNKVAVPALLQSSEQSMTRLSLEKALDGAERLAEGMGRSGGSNYLSAYFPDELLIYCFSFLDIVSLCNANLVSTDWRRLTNDALLWSEYHLRRWGQPEDQEDDANRDWRETVKARFLLERNWQSGQCHTSTLRGHTGWVTCVDFYANKLVSSSYDGTVRIWNTQTGNMLQTLKNEEVSSPVWCLQFDKNRIITGSSDSKIREFDPNNGRCVRVLEGASYCLLSFSSLFTLFNLMCTLM
ncbi:WD domain, Gbeta repeat-containing protein [Balamuthia mandrillaris]